MAEGKSETVTVTEGKRFPPVTAPVPPYCINSVHPLTAPVHANPANSLAMPKFGMAQNSWDSGNPITTNDSSLLSGRLAPIVKKEVL